MYNGWITGATEDKSFLKSLGVDLIREMRRNGDGTVSWRCRMADEAFDKLDEHWGRFVWGLMYEPMKEAIAR